MAGLPNNTFMSPGVSFYATAGGSASTLQSPVAIIPDGSGNATLAANASGIAGAATLSAVGSAGVPGGPGNVIAGGFGTAYRMGVETNAGVLQIGVNSGAVYPVISYDSQNTHQLILGDRSAVSTASIQTNLPFVVRDYAIDNTALNGVSISEDSTTACTIANACATGGSLRLGSSQAYPDAVTVRDTGAQCYTTFSGNGGNGVLIEGGTSVANISIIATTATTNTNGQLQLGASSGATNTINITDTTMTIDQVVALQQPITTTYAAAPVLPPPTTAYGGGINGTFNVSTYADGLWLFVTEATGIGITDQPTLNAMVTGTMYIKGGKVIGGGFVGVVGQSVQTQVLVGQQTVNIINSSTNNLYYQAMMYQLNGAITGL